MTTRQAFEEWFNDFHIEEMPNYQTIRDFSFAAYQAATAAALERAAVACESLFDADDDSCNEAEQCAAAIRALKDAE